MIISLERWTPANQVHWYRDETAGHIFRVEIEDGGCSFPCLFLLTSPYHANEWSVVPVLIIFIAFTLFEKSALIRNDTAIDH